jgi:hypothetical protein
MFTLASDSAAAMTRVVLAIGAAAAAVLLAIAILVPAVLLLVRWVAWCVEVWGL